VGCRDTKRTVKCFGWPSILEGREGRAGRVGFGSEQVRKRTGGQAERTQTPSTRAATRAGSQARPHQHGARAALLGRLRGRLARLAQLLLCQPRDLEEVDLAAEWEPGRDER
jgi:hypothetical protein